MSTLRRQMMQDLELGGYAETTRDHYLRAIAQFARFHGRSPAELHQPEVRLWVQHLMGQGLSTQRSGSTSLPFGSSTARRWAVRRRRRSCLGRRTWTSCR